jgi:hypothetical protein
MISFHLVLAGEESHSILDYLSERDLLALSECDRRLYRLALADCQWRPRTLKLCPKCKSGKVEKGRWFKSFLKLRLEYVRVNLVGANHDELYELANLSLLWELRTLVWAGQGLKTLTPKIWQLKALTDLDLTGNQLTTLPPEIGQLTAVTELGLSSNQLTTLPPEIGQLTALTDLWLYDNQLTTLPPMNLPTCLCFGKLLN